METKKTEITICLGSSCFARGNKSLVNIIKQFIQDNKLEDRVYFHGNHCFDQCIEGPVIKIDNTMYKAVDEAEILKILGKHFY